MRRRAKNIAIALLAVIATTLYFKWCREESCSSVNEQRRQQVLRQFPDIDDYHDCPMIGNAKNQNVIELNRFKNRYVAPFASDFDSSITLSSFIESGNDLDRFDNYRAVSVTGYVGDVRVGGVETCNCKAKDHEFRDTHIELFIDPMTNKETQRVIAEITPRWRYMMKAKGIDWTTRAIRDDFLGRWVTVTGWLLFDTEHADESENTNPGRSRNWRATAWEIHPVTNIEVVSKPLALR